MDVTRIEDEHGSYVEPPLDQDWDEFTKLTWLAAVVAHDTGLDIAVHEGGLREKHLGRWRDVPGMYSINVGRHSMAAYDYQRAWVLLTGVNVGVDAIRTKMGVTS